MAIHGQYSKADFNGTLLPRRTPEAHRGSCPYCKGKGFYETISWDHRAIEEFCDCPAGRNLEAYQLESWAAREDR